MHNFGLFNNNLHRLFYPFYHFRVSPVLDVGVFVCEFECEIINMNIPLKVNSSEWPLVRTCVQVCVPVCVRFCISICIYICILCLL